MVDWPHQTKVSGIEAMSRTWRATLSAWDDFPAIPLEYGLWRKRLVVNHIEGSGKRAAPW